MIGINKIIFEHFKNNRHLYAENLEESLVEAFIALEAGARRYEDRQDAALSLISQILEPHRKRMMTDHLIVLADLEKRFNPYDYGARDHVIHAVLTYFLGVYLADVLGISVDQFQWKLAALMHDIGYPLEKLPHHCGVLEDAINEFAQDDEFSKVSFNRKIENLEKLYDGISSFALLTNRLSKFGFNLSSRELFEGFVKNGMDHGVASSLILIKCLDALYHKHNPSKTIHSENAESFWSYDNFTIDIIESAAAIFLHNLNHNMLEQQFYSKVCPLAFLLRLSDELQDWERLDQKEGFFSADNYSFEYDADSMMITIKAPRERTERIERATKVFAEFTFNVIPEEK